MKRYLRRYLAGGSAISIESPRKPLRVIGLRAAKDEERVTKVERVMGIEPTLAAWEAAVLPLNYTRLRASL